MILENLVCIVSQNAIALISLLYYPLFSLPLLWMDRQVSSTWPNLNEIYSQLLKHLTILGHDFSILCLSKLSQGNFEHVVGKIEKIQNHIFLFPIKALKNIWSVRKKKLMTLCTVFLCLQ